MFATRSQIPVALVATALISLFVGSSIALVTYDSQQSLADSISTREAPPPPKQPLEHAENLSGAFKHAAGVISPSVVSIRSTKVFQAPARGGEEPKRSPQLPPEFEKFFDEDFFDRFGGAPFGGSFPGVPREGMRQQGQGTGVILTTDGYLVTNNHVVEGADEVQVQLFDRRSFPAEVIGTDAKTDVAVLKIEAADLTPAVIGNSDHIEVGDWVVAVGGPFGLQHTVTAGIVSAKGRADVGIVEYEDFIQTDAAINPGNSGGPLVNLRGEVIGINTAIASRSGSFAGVGFSIPMNMVQSVVGDIMDDGTVQRGWLGAAIQDLNEDLAASFNHDSTEGVLVGQVVPDSPAARAGLKAGDIIVELNGRNQSGASSLRNQVSRIKPDTTIPMVVVRDGKVKTLNVTIGLLDENVALRMGESTESGAETHSASELGVTVSTLTPELADRLGIEESAGKVVITEVESGSLAERAGLRSSELILSVNGKQVESAQAFTDAANAANLAAGIRLHVHSEGFQRFVILKRR